MALAGRLFRADVSGLFYIYPAPDAGNPDRVLLYTGQGGLGLPDESYYREEKFAPMVQAYRRPRAGHARPRRDVADPEGAAGRVVALETALASHHWDNVTLRDPQKTYNLKSAGEAAELFPLLDDWFDAAGIAPEKRAELVVSTPDFFAGAASPAGVRTAGSLAGMARHARGQRGRPVPVVRIRGRELRVLRHHHQRHAAEQGPLEARRRRRRGGPRRGSRPDLRGPALPGRPQGPHADPRGQPDRGVPAKHHGTGLDGRGQPSSRRSKKLDAFRAKIGYPDKWIDYSAVEIDPADLLGNVERAHSADVDRHLDEVGKPVDRDKWLMTPQTVNAYYHPLLNEIVFPAAILQPPFFTADADDAVNYGGIGAVIGHEIGHGFDDQGSQFDGSGLLRNWWTEEDRTAFEALAARLVAQFDALSPSAAPGHNVNGKLTLGENIGDLGGLTIAYKAYRISLDGQEPPVLDGLTGDQRFFASWAAGWRQVIRNEEAIRRLATDPHSPNEFRTNAIAKNLDAFHDAFGVTEQDGMWMAPQERVSIW